MTIQVNFSFNLENHKESNSFGKKMNIWKITKESTSLRRSFNGKII